MVYSPKRNDLPAVSIGNLVCAAATSSGGSAVGAESSVPTTRDGARRALTPERTDWMLIQIKNAPPNNCRIPSKLGRAAINADMPANEAVSHTAIPAVIPAVHHSPARTEREATRIT